MTGEKGKWQDRLVPDSFLFLSGFALGKKNPALHSALCETRDFLLKTCLRII